MDRKTIVILGDSTSSCLGADEEAYPFKLAKHKIWPPESRIINCSIPGFTSTDAAAYFFKNLKFFGKIHSVIIYLGNCDAMSTELLKGKYNKTSQFLAYTKSKLNIRPKKIKLKNKLLHFEWNYDYDRSIEAAISLDSFEYNIEKVVKYCGENNVKTVVVNPVANKLFPSGTGKGNFVFYHYFGINDKLSHNFTIEDKRFISAYKKYEEKDYLKAAELYKDIMVNPSSSVISTDLEFQSMLVNNFSVCKLMMNEFDEGKYLLETILNERNTRREIILYNLAQAEKYCGDVQRYDKLILKSYEADQSMYRIREPYRKALTDISIRNKNVALIDLNNFTSADDFVDHCHFLPNIQNIIAGKILDNIYPENVDGSSNLEIINHLFNPEYSYGNSLVFNEYFKVCSELEEHKLKEIIKDLYKKIDHLEAYDDQAKSVLDSYHPSISISFSYYRKHPCFHRIIDILSLNPTYSYDIGRFPEYFIIRKLIPYIRSLEFNSRIYDKFDHDLNLLRSSSNLMRMLPEGMEDLVSDRIDDFDVEYINDWIGSIISNSVKQLYEHLERGSQVDNRIKTTIFWYFRELLRFGSHSRISMRYERVLLENIIESLAVALVLDSLADCNMEDNISKLVKLVESIARTHEDFCCKIPQEDRVSYMERYNSELLLHSESLSCFYLIGF